jgi:hypothetical protein
VDEVEITLEVRRIDDAQDAIRLWGVGAPAEQHIAGHGLVGRAGGERIGAGQVDDRDGLAVLGVGVPIFFSTVTPGSCRPFVSGR